MAAQGKDWHVPRVLPRHSRSVALVLNLRTGHVLPQFHCQFDDICDTLRPSAGNALPLSKWQERAGFVDATRQPQVDWLDPGQEQRPADVSLPVRNHVAAPRSMDDQAQRENESGSGPLEGPNPEGSKHGGYQAPPHLVPEELLATPTGNEESTPATNDSTAARTTRSGRVSKRPTRLIEEINAFTVPWEVFHDEGYATQKDLQDPMVFVASNNPDILYIDQAMAAQDSDEFRKAMAVEVALHVDNEHWELIHQSKLPAGSEVLPAVWAFRRKRRIATQQVYKWKARLNLHGGRQTKDVNYWKTYSPVVGWPTIRLFLMLMLINGWSSQQVNFVLAYPQADIECEMFMEVPQGFHVDGSRQDYCLRLKKNLYGQKQAGQVWNQYLHDGLVARGFVQSKVDMCVYYLGSVALLIYVDDGIFIGPKQADIDAAYELLVKEFVDNHGIRHRCRGSIIKPGL